MYRRFKNTTCCIIDYIDIIVLQFTYCFDFQSKIHNGADIKKWIPSIKRDIDFNLQVGF